MAFQLLVMVKSSRDGRERWWRWGEPQASRELAVELIEHVRDRHAVVAYTVEEVADVPPPVGHWNGRR